MHEPPDHLPGRRRVKKLRRKRVRRFPGWGVLKSRQFHLAAGAILGSLFLAVALLVYLPRFYYGWKETRLLQRASIMLEQGDFREATVMANEALRLRPKSLDAFQILAEATEKQNQSETVAWRAQIARLLPENLDSQLNLASAALRFGQLDTARRALDQVPPVDQDKAPYHVVAGWLARAQGDEAGQLRHFAAAVQQDPQNDVYQFNLAVIEIASPEEARRNEARATLERLSRTIAFRTGALRALLGDAIRREDMAGAEKLAHDLQLSPQVTFADYLLCLDFYRRLDPAKGRELMAKVKEFASRTPGDLALLMEWMNEQKLAGDVIAWMEQLDPDLTNLPPASIAVAEAFAQLKNWSRLRRWTRSGAWGEAEYLRLAYQGLAARQSRVAGGDAEFDALWQAAENAAAAEPDREARLARLATSRELGTEAEQLWLRVSRHPSYRREALQALHQMYTVRGDLPNLYRITQRLHEAAPHDAAIASAYARFALLLEHNPVNGHRAARQAYEMAPDDSHAIVTYAFSLYGLGRTAEAATVLRELPPSALEDASNAAYSAIILIDDNRFEEARLHLATARSGTLYPEEKRLLEDAAARLPKATPGEGSAAPGGVP